MIRTTLLALTLAPTAFAQFAYDFNNLNGSDTHPYTLLDGQDGWTEQTYNARNRCGVTATLSHDGTQSLRFQEVGPGYGCDASRINDASWSYARFTGSETSAYFQADLLLGYWGGSFGLAHDTSVNGVIRGSEAGERGVRFNAGTQANVQFQLIAADGTSNRVPLSSIGSISGGNWLRIRVAMDLTANGGAGLGWVDVRNISAGQTSFTPVPGLQGVPLGLDPNASDATNPTQWDAVWLHFEGATYGLDNIEVGSGLARSTEYGTGCGSPALGLRGVARPVIGGSASAETTSIPGNSPAGVVLMGFTPIDPGFDLTPIGMPGCLLQVVSVTSIAFSPSGATELHTLNVPNDPSLAGGALNLQSVALSPGVNALGALTSNGLRWIFDVR